MDGVPIMPNYLTQLIENKFGEISYNAIEQEMFHKKQLIVKNMPKQ